MTEHDRDDEARLSTDEGVRPHFGTRIGTDPGHGAAVDISGGPGGATGWGAWPKGMGTSDDAADQASGETGDDDEDTHPGATRVGARHGELADSGVSTGPVGHSDG
ncbi:MAG: hypothetical protein KY456_03260 [Chloroflexi bacterium]|nr:hypothetical protein [Chloroflexota bacterium]